MADDRGDSGVGVISKAPVGLLGDHAGPFTIARHV